MTARLIAQPPVRPVSLHRGLLLALLAALASACTSTPKEQSTYSPGGYYKIGTPYEVAGVKYYPEEDWDYDEEGIASWYGDQFHGRQTANGETFDMFAMTAAHPTLPMPTRVKVTNLENGRSVILRLNDRGPFKKGRILDVSRRAAEELGFYRKGSARVRVTMLGKAPLGRASLAEEPKMTVAKAEDLQQPTVSPNGAAPVQPIITQPIPLYYALTGGPLESRTPGAGSAFAMADETVFPSDSDELPTGGFDTIESLMAATIGNPTDNMVTYLADGFEEQVPGSLAPAAPETFAGPASPILPPEPAIAEAPFSVAPVEPVVPRPITPKADSVIIASAPPQAPQLTQELTRRPAPGLQDAPVSAPFEPEPVSVPEPAAPKIEPAAQEAPKPDAARGTPIAPYDVQVGTFGVMENAEALASKLRGNLGGLGAVEIRALARDGQTLHKVVVGPVSTKESGSVLDARLRRLGIRDTIHLPR